MIERHPIDPDNNPAPWLELRRQDVNGSRAGALIGANEYVSAAALYYDKLGIVPLDDGDETGAMERGRLLEPVAVELLKRRFPTWSFCRPRLYLRDPVIRLGATPDVYAHDELGRFGVVEIKNPEPSVFRRTWQHADGSIEPPISAVIQAIVQRHLAGAEWAAVAALRVGHRLELDLVPVPADTTGVYARICEACVEFWQRVAQRRPPEPDFHRDAALLLKLFALDEADDEDRSDALIDLSGDNRLPELALRDHDLAEAIKAAEGERSAIKAELRYKMGDAGGVVHNGRIIARAKTVRRGAYKVGPKVYRDVRFTAAALPAVQD